MTLPGTHLPEVAVGSLMEGPLIAPHISVGCRCVLSAHDVPWTPRHPHLSLARQSPLVQVQPGASPAANLTPGGAQPFLRRLLELQGFGPRNSCFTPKLRLCASASYTPYGIYAFASGETPGLRKSGHLTEAPEQKLKHLPPFPKVLAAQAHPCSAL